MSLWGGWGWQRVTCPLSHLAFLCRCRFQGPRQPSFGRRGAPSSLQGHSWSCAANWVRMGHRGLPARPPSPSHSCSLGNPISPESQPGSQTDRPHSNASWEQRAGSAVLFHCDCPNYRKTLISWGFSEQSKSLEGIVLIFSPQTGSLQGLILFISHVDSGQFLNLFCPAASSHMCCGRDKGEVFVGFLEAPLRAESDPAPKGPCVACTPSPESHYCTPKPGGGGEGGLQEPKPHLCSVPSPHLQPCWALSADSYMFGSLGESNCLPY